MTKPERVLASGLRAFSILAALAGLTMMLASRPLLVRLSFGAPEAEVSTLLLVFVKEMGGLVLMLGMLLYFASRDVVRNVAVIDALIIGLCVLALTPLISLYRVDAAGSLYPAWMWWSRSRGVGGAPVVTSDHQNLRGNAHGERAGSVDAKKIRRARALRV
jgi:hypothetical protein